MKRQIAALLTATVLPLAACTATSAGNSDTVPASAASSPTMTAPSSIAPTAPDPVESSLSGTVATSTPANSATSSSTTGAANSSTSASTTATGDVYGAIPVAIPDTITGAALNAANAAIPVWRNAMRLYDESMQNPEDKWETKIRQFVGDPAAITQLSLVAAFAKDGMRQVGNTTYTAEVVKAAAHNVQIRACVDASRVDVVNADGTSITGGSAKRFLWEFNLDFYPDDVHRWLLNLVTKPNPTKPC
jgi:hypothetical protein